MLLTAAAIEGRAFSQRVCVSAIGRVFEDVSTADCMITCLVQVAAKQMVGLYLSIWVTKSLLLHIRGVQVASVGTGVLGYLGNKGNVTYSIHSLCPFV